MPFEPVEARSLEETIIDEAFWVLGLNNWPWLCRLIEPIFRSPIGRFSRLAADFENAVVQKGLHHAIRDFMPQFIAGIDLIGAETLPASEPLLIATNHPAAYDFFLIAATLPRDDLKLVASNINIIRRLPATAEHFIFIGSKEVMGDTHSRMAAVRASVRHLKRGGALLIFPTGTVDPDPAVNPEGARQALHNWSPSLDLLVRLVPETRIVVTIVSGVLSRRWYNSPVTWLRQEPHNKQKVAEVFQVMQQLYFPNTLKLRPCLSFSRPLSRESIIGRDSQNEIVPALIVEAQKQLKGLFG
ncbi:MAG: 1-acyl-sn-glycerol-3-phosphate acyltransferase [Chloroflexota bacterium]